MKIVAYDLAHSPASYDFLTHLQAGRLKLGDPVHVVFVPPKGGYDFAPPVRPPWPEAPPADAPMAEVVRHLRALIEAEPDTPSLHDLPRIVKPFRLAHICETLCIAAGATFTLAPGRGFAQALIADGEDVYPRGYDARGRAWYDYYLSALIAAWRKTGTLPDLQASAYARDQVSAYLAGRGGRAGVSITLRRYDHQAERNADEDAWTAVATWLDDRGYQPVVVPDTDGAASLTGVSGPVFAAAALDLDLRLALYEACVINLGVSTGPMALCHYSGLPYLTFKLLADADGARPNDFAVRGLPPGSQYPWAGPRQRLVWGPDDFDTITTAFTETMMAAQAA